MEISYYFFFVCLGILSINLASALPPSSILDLESNRASLQNHNTTFLTNEYQCFEVKLRKDRRARKFDCLRAAAFLPNLHEPGVFHRGTNPDDNYVLPWVKTINTCRIKIGLTFGRPDQSSWIAINLALRGILDACQLTISAERTGGQTTAGTSGRVTIIAENAEWPENDFTPATSVERLRQ